MEGRWIPSGKAERPPSNAIYVHNESPNFGAHWMKEPVNFSKLKLSNKKSEPGMVSVRASPFSHRAHSPPPSPLSPHSLLSLPIIILLVSKS